MANIFTSFKGDPQDINDVCIVKINGIQLPLDVQISIDGSKIIAQSQILDGVAVYEKVTRKPYNIDLDFVVRGIKKTQPTGIIPGLTFNKPIINQWVFGMEDSEDNGIYYPGITTINGYCWETDKVLPIENVFLNKLGIQQIIISDIQMTTIRGSINLPVKFKCLEDYYSIKTQGTTLII